MRRKASILNLTKNDPAYKQQSRFLLKFETKGGEKFSCPALVAASYLYRLGYLDQKAIKPLAGQAPRVSSSGNILTILPTKYLQVEANARTICELIEPPSLSRIGYYFY